MAGAQAASAMPKDRCRLETAFDDLPYGRAAPPGQKDLADAGVHLGEPFGADTAARRAGARTPHLDAQTEIIAAHLLFYLTHCYC